MQGLYLGPYGNSATFIQDVTAGSRTIVLEGGVRNGGVGVRQTLIINRDAFQFGKAAGY